MGDGWHRVVLAFLLTLLTPAAARALVLPTGFSESVVWSGFNPTNIEFAADGRIFVSEKSGLIKVFDNEADQTATSSSPTCVQRPRLLGPGHAGPGRVPQLPGQPVRVRPLHLRRPHRRVATDLG